MMMAGVVGGMEDGELRLKWKDELVVGSHRWVALVAGVKDEDADQLMGMRMRMRMMVG